MSAITWLHLSDFHFRASQTYDSDIVLQALLRDLDERIHKDNLQPDFVILSGDIAFASRPEEYALAQKFFGALLKTANLTKDRLFLVPGNHDIDRDKTTSTFAASAPSILNNRDAVNRFLDNDAERNLVLQRFHNYQDFVNKYLGKRRLPFDHKRYYYVKHIEMVGKRVAILGLNSAWLAASDEDRNRLLLGERQVRAALGKVKDADLCLAVMHHPFDWIQDFDRSVVNPLLCDNCDFVLHGHMHQVGLLEARTPDSKAMIIAAGACYETREYPNSYNFVQLDFSTGKGTVHLRMYSDRRGGFWAKDVLSYRNVDDGTYTFNFLNIEPSSSVPVSVAANKVPERAVDESAIRPEIKAIDKTLAELKEQFERGYIDPGRYSRLKTDWERQKAKLEAQFKDVTAPSRKAPGDQAPGVAPEGQASTRRRELRNILGHYFDEGELRDLCFFELNIDYDDLPGQGKGDKIRGLIARCERLGRTHELEQACRRLRPHAFT